MASTFLLPAEDIDHMIPLSTNPVLTEFQKELDGAYWRPDEIKFEKDITQWKTITQEERQLCENAIVEFNIWDNEVSKVYSGTGETFVKDITLPQLSMLYTQIASWEVIHARSYALMGTTLLGAKRMEELMSEKTRPAYITKKAKWFAENIKSRYDGPAVTTGGLQVSMTYNGGNPSLPSSWSDVSTQCVIPGKLSLDKLRDHARQVTVTCAVEGLFFQPKFTGIYWLKKRGLMEAFAHANELISRDEGLHFRLAAAYLKLLGHPLTVKETKTIFMEACELECEGIMEKHPSGLAGFSAESLCQYTRHTCDYLLTLVFEKPTRAYGVENPYSWLVSTAATRQTSFFERTVSEYDSRTIGPQDKLQIIEGDKW